MDASAQGAFCQSCQKEVIDFTKMNDETLRSFFEDAPKRVCGRFRTNQLDRNLYSPIIKRGMGAWKYAWAFPAFLIGLMIPPTQMQAQATTEQTDSQSSTQTILNQTSNNSRIISGFVFDEMKEPILGATIQVSGTLIGTLTDDNGYFELNIPNIDSSLLVLNISSIGFETKEVLINVTNSSHDTILRQIELTFHPVIVGGICVRRSFFKRIWWGVKGIFRRR